MCYLSIFLYLFAAVYSSFIYMRNPLFWLPYCSNLTACARKSFCAMAFRRSSSRTWL